MDLGYSEKINCGRQLKTEIKSVDALIENLCCAAEQYVSSIMFQGSSMMKHTGKKYHNLSQNKLIVTLLGANFNAVIFAIDVLQRRIKKYAKYFSWNENQQKEILNASIPVVKHFCNSEAETISTVTIQDIWKKLFASSINFEKSSEFSDTEYDVWRFIPLIDSNLLKEQLQSPHESVLKKILNLAEDKIARTTKNREIISCVLAVFPQREKNSVEQHPLVKQLEPLLK